MRLSEALRAGIAKSPSSQKPFETISMGAGVEWPTQDNRILREMWPELGGRTPRMPEQMGHLPTQSLEWTVGSLGDWWGWTLEAIAEWLEGEGL